MIVDDIREHLASYLIGSVFSYGRPFDTALATGNIEISQWFIHLDPITFDGEVSNFERASLAIGFLKQDKPDSSFDEAENLDTTESIEAIQSEAKDTAIAWLNDFLDNYSFSGNSYTITPATRVKNVMSGCLMKVTLSYKPSC